MAFTTLPSAGAKLRASVLASLIIQVRPITAFKSASTARTSTAVRVADPDLIITLPANSEWDFECLLIMDSAANAAGDFSGEFAFPADATVSLGAIGLVDTLASGTSADANARGMARDALTPTANFDFGCSTGGTAVLIMGRIEVITAGNLTLNWAQQTSNINATTLRSGSRLTANRAS